MNILIIFLIMISIQFCSKEDNSDSASVALVLLLGGASPSNSSGNQINDSNNNTPNVGNVTDPEVLPDNSQTSSRGIDIYVDGIKVNNDQNLDFGSIEYLNSNEKILEIKNTSSRNIELLPYRILGSRHKTQGHPLICPNGNFFNQCDISLFQIQTIEHYWLNEKDCISWGEAYCETIKFSIPSNESRKFRLKFLAYSWQDSAVNPTAIFSFRDSDSNHNIAEINLGGKILIPRLALYYGQQKYTSSSQSLKLPSIKAGSTIDIPLKIRNEGNGSLKIFSSRSDRDPIGKAPFDCDYGNLIDGHYLNTIVLSPGGEFTIPIRFSPNNQFQYNCSLLIGNNDPFYDSSAYYENRSGFVNVSLGGILSLKSIGEACTASSECGESSCESGICGGIGIGCNNDSQCANSNCSNFVCGGVGTVCLDDSYCANGNKCALGRCVNGLSTCINDSNCGSNKKCVDGFCTNPGTSCTENYQCIGSSCGKNAQDGDGRKCGGLGSTCSSSSDCFGFSCDQGKCRIPFSYVGQRKCSSADDCANGQGCGKDGICGGVGASCTNESGCGFLGINCSNGICGGNGASCSHSESCLTGICTNSFPQVCSNIASSVGNTCTSNANCQNSSCSEGVCGGSSASCTNDSQCGYGRTCGNGICGGIGAKCNTNSQCSGSLACGNGMCGGTNASCHNDGSCLSSWCKTDNKCSAKSGKIGSICSTDIDCKDSNCYEGTCGKNGANCTGNWQCAGKLCFGGSCFNESYKPTLCSLFSGGDPRKECACNGGLYCTHTGQCLHLTLEAFSRSCVAPQPLPLSCTELAVGFFPCFDCNGVWCQSNKKCYRNVFGPSGSLKNCPGLW